MKDIIQNILDIENKANKIIDEGVAQKQELLDSMNEDIEKMRKDINLMVEVKLHQLDETEKAEAANSIERINMSAIKRLESMDGLYRENRDNWVQTVFNIIIGSENSES